MYYGAVCDSYNITIITHNRPELLEKSIKSVLCAVKGRDVPINVIWQQPEDSTVELTSRVIDKYSHHFKKIEIQQKKYSIPEHNIDTARLIALEIAFRDPSIKYAIVLEDDVCLADDVCDFIESIIVKHGTKKAFRGVNFGSKEINGDASGYSKNRYGIHGPASMITRRTLIKSGLAKRSNKNLPKTWDGFIESYLKTGYMVTPNLSRYIDLGVNGTHTNESNLEYFRGLQASFKVMNETKFENMNYSLIQISHRWRHDCVEYKSIETPLYVIKYLAQKLQEHRVSHE
jgi:hypothetical protein